KMNTKALIACLFMPFVPNLIVMFRFYKIYGWEDIFNYFFNFEYLTLFNLIVSEVIHRYTSYNDFLFGSTYLASLKLIIPSFLRELLSISVDRGADISNVRLDAGVSGGGFSLVGELYMNFGLFSFIPVFIYSFALNSYLYKIVSKFNSGKYISLFYCIFPLVLIMSILSLRNDTSSLIKYTLQLFIISGVFYIAFKAGENK
ncbi:hypothetical protein RRM63_003562, partial [Photobacterium damselae]|nr:hypothetical protein [Photobacterium damselae]